MLVSLDFCICDFNNKNVPLRWSLKSSDGSLSAPNKLFAFVARKAASRACNQVDMNIARFPNPLLEVLPKASGSGNLANMNNDGVDDDDDGDDDDDDDNGDDE